MHLPRELIYIGSDKLQFAFLQSNLPELPVRWHSEFPEELGLKNWNRIVVLDVGAQGFDVLLKLKQMNAGVPVILLADHDDLPITQISNAFYDGAELMLHKPLANPAVLIDCIRDCCRRLDHWGRLLIQHAQ